MNFLQIDANLLRNRYWTPADKLVLSYLISLQKQKKSYYGSSDYIGTLLGLKPQAIDHILQRLIERGIIYRASDRTIHLATTAEEIYYYDGRDAITTMLQTAVEQFTNKAGEQR